jgi:thiamine-phosphate pyrophosphorylase
MKPTIPIPCLGLVTDRRLCHSDMRALEDVVARAVKGGVNLVQLREKELPGGELLNLAKRLRKVTAGSASLFINDRVDVAIACDADGVQLGEKRMPVEAARKVSGDGLVIGRSVHSLEGAVEAEVEGADFLLVGAIFPTSSHGGEEPTGPQLLSRIADRTGIPLAGIGGITPANLRGHRSGRLGGGGDQSNPGGRGPGAGRGRVEGGPGWRVGTCARS